LSHLRLPEQRKGGRENETQKGKRREETERECEGGREASVKKVRDLRIK
jgi:hypothetical protein